MTAPTDTHSADYLAGYEAARRDFAAAVSDEGQKMLVALIMRLTPAEAGGGQG